jgi:hypothetical protein
MRRMVWVPKTPQKTAALKQAAHLKLKKCKGARRRALSKQYSSKRGDQVSSIIVVCYRSAMLGKRG